MRRIIATEFMTLDGVVEAPEKWSLDYWNDESEKYKNDELRDTGALLLGRVTYEVFAAAWPSRRGDFADRWNALPKYVASSTLKDLAWSGSQLLPEPVAHAAADLKKSPGGNIFVHGSPTLVRSLMEEGLVDELRILVYPLVVGGGKRLFEHGPTATFELVESNAFRSGVVALVYRNAGPA